VRNVSQRSPTHARYRAHSEKAEGEGEGDMQLDNATPPSPGIPPPTAIAITIAHGSGCTLLEWEMHVPARDVRYITIDAPAAYSYQLFFNCQYIRTTHHTAVNHYNFRRCGSSFRWAAFPPDLFSSLPSIN